MRWTPAPRASMWNWSAALRPDPGARRRHRHRTRGDRNRAGAARDQQDCLSGRSGEQSPPLGFRGEALPSIASVSRLSLVSRTAATEHAWGLEARDGRRGSPGSRRAPRAARAWKCADLFFNVPARRKFLRTESHRISAHCGHARAPGPVAVRGGILASRTTAAASGRCAGAFLRAEELARVAKICGEEFAAHVIEVRHDLESLHLRGWLALRPSRAGQSICSSGS